jgi:alpha-beta hydrolase superfamily lysophospholipase
VTVRCTNGPPMENITLQWRPGAATPEGDPGAVSRCWFHGATYDHTTAWRFVGPELERRFTVYAMDRRGRGRSGDSRVSMRSFSSWNHDSVRAVRGAMGRTRGAPPNGHARTQKRCSQYLQGLPRAVCKRQGASPTVA